MGQALARGWCASELPANALITLDRNPSSRTAFYDDVPCRTVASLEALRDACHPAILCLAVKPQQLGELLPELRRVFKDTMPLIVSVAAGVSMASISQQLGQDCAIIRLMPNTPTQLCFGMCGAIENAAVLPKQHAQIDALMRAVGQIVWLDDEAQMHALTAISGSGPAYVFYVMECLMKAAAEQGFNDETARLLVSQTFLGAANMAAQLSDSVATLRRNVTSPNGTTEAALAELMSEQMHTHFSRAVAAAISRSETLSQ